MIAHAYQAPARRRRGALASEMRARHSRRHQTSATTAEGDPGGGLSTTQVPAADESLTRRRGQRSHRSAGPRPERRGRTTSSARCATPLLAVAEVSPQGRGLWHSCVRRERPSSRTVQLSVVLEERPPSQRRADADQRGSDAAVATSSAENELGSAPVVSRGALSSRQRQPRRAAGIKGYQCRVTGVEIPV